MHTFSIKVPEQLHERLERHLRERGLTRSGFVRELIERELQPKASHDRAPEHPIARFKGAIKGARHSRDDALRVDDILASEGYGADGVDP